MRWLLRYQLLFPFAGVMLLALVGVSALNAYLAAQRSKQQVEDQLARIGPTLHNATFPLNDTVLQQLRDVANAEFVLTDSAGKVYATSKPELAPLAPALPTKPAESFQLGPAVEVAGERYFHTVVAIRPSSAQSSGSLLHILYPERVWRESQWDAMQPPVIVGSVALALVALVSIIITRRLSRPIAQLKTQVGHLAQGEFQPIPLPNRDDELRELVISVNSLAGQLDELRQVIRRTERLSLLGQLSGGLAHHLRNCVTGARLAVQLHQRQCQNADQESLGVALRQLILSDEHLQRFLAVGKPQPPQLAELDLRTLLDEVDSLVGLSCRHRKIDLQFKQPPQPVVVHADAEQLRQLLLNLVLNAIDAVSSNTVAVSSNTVSVGSNTVAVGNSGTAGGNHGTVRVEIDLPSAQTVRLRVFDSGPGPPPELVEKLFEPFVTGKREGIGLGLAVSRQIADAHGGTLRYVREGETCFELVLPSGGLHPLRTNGSYPEPHEQKTNIQKSNVPEASTS